MKDQRGMPALPRLPKIFSVTLQEKSFLHEAREREECAENICFENITAEGEDFSRLTAAGVKFVNCRFWNCSFEGAGFVDTGFLSCDFSGSNLHGTYFSRVEFKGCKGVGSKFTDSILKDISFYDCCLSYINLDSCKLERVSFQESELTHGSIAQCKCKSVQWQRVQLCNVSFFKTPLRGMDFSDSVIEGLILSESCEELRGAVVDLYQAAALAKRLGVIIKDMGL